MITEIEKMGLAVYDNAVSKWRVVPHNNSEWNAERLPDWRDDEHVVESVELRRFFSEEEAQHYIRQMVINEVLAFAWSVPRAKKAAVVTPEQAAVDVARERLAATMHKAHEAMSTEERCKLQGDGFINDYD